jgi:hypothetical protein
MKNVTEFDIISYLYHELRNDFENRTDKTEVLVHVDFDKMARDLNIDRTTLEDRLKNQYHVKYLQNSSNRSEFLTSKHTGRGRTEREFINYPLVETVYSELLDSDEKYKGSIFRSNIAIIISILALIITAIK